MYYNTISECTGPCSIYIQRNTDSDNTCTLIIERKDNLYPRHNTINIQVESVGFCYTYMYI